MVYILHLETATKMCSVALSKNGECLAVKETQEDGYAHGENLNLFIQQVLSEAKITTQDLSAVSLASGPGSYTGLRIGASTAKSLCYALDIPLIAIDALSSLVELVGGKEQHMNRCAVIDARRMEVYNLFTDADGKHLKEISADIIETDTYKAYEPFLYFGDGAAKLREVWKGRNCRFEDIRSSARGQVKLAYQKYLDQEVEDVAYFEPFYLKDFIAGKKKDG